MKDRLLKLRKSLKLSQDKFGARLGITGAAISRLEAGERNLTDTMIKLICSTFNVSEVWLQTGEGEMFHSDPDDELAWLIGALHAEDDEFRKNFIIEICKIPNDRWGEIKSFLLKLAKS